MWSGTGDLVGRGDEITAIRDALRDRAGTHLLECWQAPNSAFSPWRAEAAIALHSLGDGDGAPSEAHLERAGALVA